jgi:predicted  nucleic acid-binding Zn-ribbon protein
MAQRNQQWTNQQNLKWNNRMMGDSKSQTEIAEKKIAKEEQNRQKLEEKITQLNSDLEKQRNQLLALENSPNNTNDYTQKECKKTKGQIAKIEEKLSKTKTELEASSKKIEILKLVGKFSVTNKEQLNK